MKLGGVLKNKLSKEAKSATVYTFSTLFSRGLAVITVPIFTRLMSTEQIGIVNLYSSWYSILSVFATLSLTSGGFSLAMKEYENERDQYVSSVQTLTSILTIILFGIYLLFHNFINNITGLPVSLILLMFIGCLFAPARDFWLARQRYEYKYRLAGCVTIIAALFASLLSILVVIMMNNNGQENLAEGRLFANYLVVYTVAAVIWIYQFLKGKTFFHKQYWKMSLQLSLPLVGYSLATQIFNVSDRMMISYLVGNSEVGIYSTLYSVSSISLLFWSALNSSFVPYLYQNIDNSDSKIKPLSFNLLFTYSIIAIVLVFFAPEIVRILATDEYYQAIYIMPPIAAGIFLTAVANMYSNILVYYKKTKYVMYAASVAAVVNLATNYIFIQSIGYMAAAYTTMLSYIIFAVLEMYWGIKTHRKCSGTVESVYYDRRIVLLSIATMLISLSGLVLYDYYLLRYIIALIVVFTLYIILNKSKKQ